MQTCIVNVDKRHAFVKMLTRKDAMMAKEGMERYRSTDMQLRVRIPLESFPRRSTVQKFILILPWQTRWGVGFGPRDCSDYQTGISIIPIDRLTDADRKWMLTAEYGGTGGKDILSGLVAEEPDIEIGAGVSSKGDDHHTISRACIANDLDSHQQTDANRQGWVQWSSVLP